MNELELFIFENTRFSFSSASTFNTCSYGWYLTYIASKEREENFFAQYGKFIHQMFELYWKRELEDFELLDYYEQNFDKAVNLLPPPFPVGMAQRYYQEGLDFFSSPPFDRDDYDVLVLEGTINSKRGKTSLVVKPDLLIKNKKSGKIILLDYKTSNPLKNGKPDKKKLEGYERQLILYAKFCEKELKIKIDEIVLLFVRSKEMPFYAVERNPEKEKIVMKWFFDTIKKIKKTDSFDATPSAYFCSHICSVRSSCDKKEV